MIRRVQARRPVHQVQVDVVGPQVRQRLVDGLGHALVPRVVQLGGQPDVAARHPRRLDALADLLLVAVRGGRVDVAVAVPQGGLDRLPDITGLGLPCAEPDSGDGVARVELVGLAGGVVSMR